MRYLVTLLVAVVVTLTVVTTADASPKYDGSPWIKLWEKRDHNLKESTRVAATIFKVSERWMRECNEDEGGNVARWKLAISLKRGVGKGWNADGYGSAAFGPWQFMLDRKPPQHSGQWGTFSRYVHRAFSAAKRRGYAVPYRFKRPDSFVGQAITTAYMFSIGESRQWVGAGCN